MNLYNDPFALIEVRMKIAFNAIISTPSKYVYDFGCLHGYLGTMLHGIGKKYFPYDSVQRFPHCIIQDFNMSFPIITTDRKDNLSSCLGIFEYILDVPTMIQNISRHFAYVVFSYLDKDAILDAKAPLPQGTAPLLPHGEVVNIFANNYSHVQLLSNIGASFTSQKVYLVY